MSIAVSAVVKPSTLLLGMVTCMSVGISLLGIAIGFGGIGELPSTLRIAYALFSIFLAIFGFYWTVKSRKTHHIDISGIGQIRLGEYRHSSAQGAVVEDGDSELVTLMSDSTLWPHLLVLRLRGADEQTKIILILRDSVGHEIFRSLSVACRWIVLRNQQSDPINF